MFISLFLQTVSAIFVLLVVATTIDIIVRAFGKSKS